MGRYIRRRLITAIPVFFGITLLVFLMVNLAPGTIVDLMGEGASSGADRAALEQALGLDRPLPVRYAGWLAGLLRGELGQSFFYDRPVSRLIAQRVGPSLLLTGSGVALAVVLALPLGILAAWKPRSLWERLASLLSLVSFGVPGFLLCLGGIALFSVTLGWLPTHGMYTFGTFTSLADLLRHLLLPAGVVCLSSLGELVKQTRAACLEALGQDYILTARAKGLSEGAVMVRHAFRGSLVPVLTTILSHIPHILGGSVVVEQIFGWPGMGSLLFSGISQRDYPVVMGVSVVTALTVLLTNLLLDLVYGLADPRVRYGKG
ncbi:ABC transporter permease [uncultured Flavonifractor sp.]|uniref:ABC transporter permease n=1 Tax=uncultured Flavonifractor sp. TaxID=1193534 RepID=UPI002624007F|nr:ABC transporter permease [uncultured Flavonifractor sp.]